MTEKSNAGYAVERASQNIGAVLSRAQQKQKNCRAFESDVIRAVASQSMVVMHEIEKLNKLIYGAGL